MDVLNVLLGIAFAVYGAHLLVDGGSAIAKRFGIPSLVIGSTIVAFGTSMPEFTVNMHSALSGKTDLAMGNILGSNLFNIAVTFLLVIYVWFSRQKQLGRGIGGFLLLSYVGYIIHALV